MAYRITVFLLMCMASILQDHLRCQLPSSGGGNPRNSPSQEEVSNEVDSDNLIRIPTLPTAVIGPPESTMSNSNSGYIEQNTDTTTSPTGSPTADERSPETVE